MLDPGSVVLIGTMDITAFIERFPAIHWTRAVNSRTVNTAFASVEMPVLNVQETRLFKYEGYVYAVKYHKDFPFENKCGWLTVIRLPATSNLRYKYFPKSFKDNDDIETTN